MPAPRPHDIRLPYWTWAVLPVLIAAWLRLRGIGEPEPFVDEGATILTALDPRVRALFDPLGQGRPWLAHLFKPAGWFTAHVLTVARAMSAGAGLVTLGALGWILHRLAGRAAALCGLWCWALLPLAVFHERLALQDPFVTALLASALAVVTTSSLGGEKARPWIWSGTAGVFLGAAFLLKISAVFALPWLGLLYWEIQRQAARPLFDRRLAWLALGALIPVLSLGSGVARLGGDLGSRFHVLPTLDGHGGVPSPLEHLGILLEWYGGYGGWPLALLAIAAMFGAGFFRQRLAFACALGWLGSLLVTSLCYGNPYARYLLPDHLPLLLFLALAWGKILHPAPRWRTAAWAVVALALARWGFVSWGIGTDPWRAAVPAGEIAQYFTGPWSGRGLKEVRAYLDRYADRQQVRCLVLTHRFMRAGCYGLLLAERGDPRLGVVPFTVYEPEELTATRPGLRHAAAGQRVAFFLLYEGSLYPPPPWLDAAGGPARRVLEVPRGGSEEFTLYQFEP